MRNEISLQTFDLGDYHALLLTLNDSRTIQARGIFTPNGWIYSRQAGFLNFTMQWKPTRGCGGNFGFINSERLTLQWGLRLYSATFHKDRRARRACWEFRQSQIDRNGLRKQSSVVENSRHCYEHFFYFAQIVTCLVRYIWVYIVAILPPEQHHDRLTKIYV